MDIYKLMNCIKLNDELMTPEEISKANYIITVALESYYRESIENTRRDSHLDCYEC